jgi:hypothetical protein
MGKSPLAVCAPRFANGGGRSAGAFASPSFGGNSGVDGARACRWERARWRYAHRMNRRGATPGGSFTPNGPKGGNSWRLVHPEWTEGGQLLEARSPRSCSMDDLRHPLRWKSVSTNGARRATSAHRSMINGPASVGLKVALFTSVSRCGHRPTTSVEGHRATKGMKTYEGIGCFREAPSTNAAADAAGGRVPGHRESRTSF